MAGLLVEARYAIRNNQRSFLKATLPAGFDRVERAGLAAVRCGPASPKPMPCSCRSKRDGPGEDAPTGVVELVYIQPIDAWVDKGHARIDLRGARPARVRALGVELALFAANSCRTCSPDRFAVHQRS
jgi:hypothetical protein